jgi:hypothetical protein
MDRMHKSMAAYIKAISKRNEGDDKEKVLPIAHLGSSMVSHGERDFDMHSEFGQCLIRKYSKATPKMLGPQSMANVGV